MPKKGQRAPVATVRSKRRLSATSKARGARKKSTASPTAPPAIHRGLKDLYVLSDSTGNLARHMLAAMLTQFPKGSAHVHFRTFVRSPQPLDEVLAQVRAHPGGICHAMVSAAFKQRIAEFCHSANLPHHDLTGGLVDFLSQVTALAPRGDLRLIHRIDEDYKRRIGALEYTIDHDDGLGLDTLADADIVLAGVSRTGKTPTSIYLAQQGYRVANVALAIESAPPKELLGLPPGKAVGLVINPQQLVMIRQRRATGWNLGRTSYGDPAHVAREIAWARQLFARQNWPVLDVTDQAIEETAGKIVQALGLKGPSRNTPGDLP
jgi:regulator of PEP synthase PpsR (kinase-PPPase family)